MTICVYGASSNVIDETFAREVERLGEIMAMHGHTLVFGGGSQGLMGASARGMYKYGGRIIGVAPSFFDVDGVLFEHCDEMIYTETMRERKQIMEDKSDAFVVTPGGFGTFEEFFEILTLKQLARHQKAIVVLNINGYYDSLFDFIDEAMDKSFIKTTCTRLYEIVEDVEDVLPYIESYKPEQVSVEEMKDIKSKYVYESEIRE